MAFLKNIKLSNNHKVILVIGCLLTLIIGIAYFYKFRKSESRTEMENEDNVMDMDMDIDMDMDMDMDMDIDIDMDMELAKLSNDDEEVIATTSVSKINNKNGNLRENVVESFINLNTLIEGIDGDDKDKYNININDVNLLDNGTLVTWDMTDNVNNLDGDIKVIVFHDDYNNLKNTVMIWPVKKGDNGLYPTEMVLPDSDFHYALPSSDAYKIGVYHEKLTNEVYDLDKIITINHDIKNVPWNRNVTIGNEEIGVWRTIPSHSVLLLGTGSTGTTDRVIKFLNEDLLPQWQNKLYNYSIGVVKYLPIDTRVIGGRTYKMYLRNIYNTKQSLSEEGKNRLNDTIFEQHSYNLPSFWLYDVYINDTKESQRIYYKSSYRKPITAIINPGVGGTIEKKSGILKKKYFTTWLGDPTYVSKIVPLNCNNDRNCHKCGSDGKCQRCKNRKYLTADGVCVDTCPAGYANTGKAFRGRKCVSIGAPPPMAPPPMAPPPMAPPPMAPPPMAPVADCNNDRNCHKCGPDGKCQRCKNRNYLTADGVCVDTCPAGYTNTGKAFRGRKCVPNNLNLSVSDISSSYRPYGLRHKGSLKRDGIYTLPKGSTLTINKNEYLNINKSNFIVDGTIINNGIIDTTTLGGTINISNSGIINNTATGLISNSGSIDSGGRIYSAINNISGGSINNNGRIYIGKNLSSCYENPINGPVMGKQPLSECLGWP